MSSGISGKTPQYGFNLISFDYPRWGTFEHENWRMLDAILQGSLVSPAGAWRNNTSYPIGARVIDVTNYNTYAAGVAHTSSATGTFADERAAFPTRWSQVLNAPVYRGPWAPSTAYNYLDIVSQPTGEFYIAKAAHTSGGTFDNTYWVQTSVAASTWGSISGKPADVRLKFVNTTTIRLDGIKTNRITINSLDRVVPTTGPTLLSAGLTVGTLYYIYAYWTGSVVALEASTTTHATHTDGIEIKSGDPTRTLIGVAQPITGALWAFSGHNYLVRSYYNRARLGAHVPFTSSYPGVGSSTIEVGGGAERVNFLAWDDESALIVLNTAWVQPTANTACAVQSVGYNGANVIGALSNGSTSVAGGVLSISSSVAMRCTEGLNYSTVQVSTAAGSASVGGAQSVFVG